MFNLNTYLNELVVTKDDEEYIKANDIIELTNVQLEYLGGTLLPNAQSRAARMASKGIIGESYTIDSWFGTANEDDPHVNDEISFDQQLDDQQTFIGELQVRMRTAAILFVTRLKAHDEISMDLQQLTYSGIKAKSASNREARQKSTG